MNRGRLRSRCHRMRRRRSRRFGANCPRTSASSLSRSSTDNASAMQLNVFVPGQMLLVLAAGRRVCSPPLHDGTPPRTALPAPSFNRAYSSQAGPEAEIAPLIIGAAGMRPETPVSGLDSSRTCLPSTQGRHSWVPQAYQVVVADQRSVGNTPPRTLQAQLLRMAPGIAGAVGKSNILQSELCATNADGIPPKYLTYSLRSQIHPEIGRAIPLRRLKSRVHPTTGIRISETGVKLRVIDRSKRAFAATNP